MRPAEKDPKVNKLADILTRENTSLRLKISRLIDMASSCKIYVFMPDTVSKCRLLQVVSMNRLTISVLNFLYLGLLYTCAQNRISHGANCAMTIYHLVTLLTRLQLQKAGSVDVCKIIAAIN